MKDYYVVSFGLHKIVCSTLGYAYNEYLEACNHTEFVELLHVEDGRVTTIEQSW